MNYFEVYSLDQDGQQQDVVSVLPHEHVLEHGLIPESVVGVLDTAISAGGEVKPGNFVKNSVFVTYLHKFIAAAAPNDPMIERAAKQQGSGYVYIIDARTPTPDAEVPPEDIIGAFSVQDGSILVNTYSQNPRHLILSDSGFFRLSPPLMKQLREGLMGNAQQAVD